LGCIYGKQRVVLENYLDPKISFTRQAHNLKVVGSNPTPATNLFNKINDLYDPQRLRFLGFFVFKTKNLTKSG
jgi:hypothetical protein